MAAQRQRLRISSGATVISLTLFTGAPTPRQQPPLPPRSRCSPSPCGCAQPISPRTYYTSLPLLAPSLPGAELSRAPTSNPEPADTLRAVLLLRRAPQLSLEEASANASLGGFDSEGVAPGAADLSVAESPTPSPAEAPAPQQGLGFNLRFAGVASPGGDPDETSSDEDGAQGSRGEGALGNGSAEAECGGPSAEVPSASSAGGVAGGSSEPDSAAAGAGGSGQGSAVPVAVSAETAAPKMSGDSGSGVRESSSDVAASAEEPHIVRTPSRSAPPAPVATASPPSPAPPPSPAAAPAPPTPASAPTSPASAAPTAAEVHTRRSLSLEEAAEAEATVEAAVQAAITREGETA